MNHGDELGVHWGSGAFGLTQVCEFDHLLKLSKGLTGPEAGFAEHGAVLNLGGPYTNSKHPTSGLAGLLLSDPPALIMRIAATCSTLILKTLSLNLS